jgi:hypothetical protein
MTQAGVRSSILGPNSGVVSPGREGGPPYRSFFRRSNRSRSMRLFSLIHWRSCFRRTLVVDSIKKLRCDRVSVERSTPIRFKASSNSGWVMGNSMVTPPPYPMPDALCLWSAAFGCSSPTTRRVGASACAAASGEDSNGGPAPARMNRPIAVPTTNPTTNQTASMTAAQANILMAPFQSSVERYRLRATQSRPGCRKRKEERP